MGKYIYINYAYEDQDQVMAIVRQLQAAGIQVYYGNGSEEKVAESVCVIHFCTEASHTSKSYRKIMNYTLKHEVDCMLFHLGGQNIISDVEMQLDVLHTMFKYKFRQDEPANDIKDTEATEAAEQPVVTEESPEEMTEQSVVTETEPEKAAPEEKMTEPEKVPTKEELFREGKRWLTGDGCDVDVEKAFVCFRQSASQGHVEAQYQLSVCYDKGIGVRRSISEAAKWCQMAAYGGHAQAQSEIGYCYEYGQGVVRNIREAVRWYEIASDQGNIEAKNNLAFCYQKGKGVIKNVQKAIQLYQEAADAGHASAQYNLGFCYWYGEGIKSDKPKAIELFKQSADNGNAKAVQMLKILNQHAYVR
ncbi:MAG: hypothetical protein ACI4BB_10410 [Coprococcus sp.]